MANSSPCHFPVGASAADPRVREEMVAKLRVFHQEQAQVAGHDKLLKVYCRALSNWMLNPNTEAYHVEMLFDELCHTASQDDPATETADH